MTEAFYELLSESEPGALSGVTRLRATSHTNGPWQQGLQHAGPPGAALLRSVCRLGGLPPHALPARLCFDILAPVPVTDLEVRVRVLRPGARILLAAGELAAAARPDRTLMTLRAWLVRQDHGDSGIPTRVDGWVPDPGTAAQPRPPGWQPGYLDAMRWEWVEGAFDEPGPATVWARQLVDLVAGEQPTAVERLVALCDSASGISAVADPGSVLFVNTDLTIHLDRAPVNERLWLRAESFISPTGVGRASGVVGDEKGVVGHTGQTLFVAPRESTD